MSSNSRRKQTYEPFLSIVWLSLFTALIFFPKGVSEAKHIKNCEAIPQLVLSNGTTTLSVLLNVTKQSQPITIVWRQIKPRNPLGRFGNPASSVTTFRAPQVGSEMDFNIQVTVTDAEGGPSTCDVIVKVKKGRTRNWTDVGKLFENVIHGTKPMP